MYNGKVDFGFGCMRLPVLDKSDPTSFDTEKICRLFDSFLENGFTYFDTAYTYHRERGEMAVRECLVKRHPRESFELCTKLPLRKLNRAEDLEKLFNEQLENCGVDYFDYYMLHNLGSSVYDKVCELDVFSFVYGKKAQNKVKMVGMSFHDSPELLEKVLEKFGDMLDYVQLQVNYADWEYPAIQSRKCVEICKKFGKPITVMEPCKGGTLARLPEEAAEVLRQQDENASQASWAFRFAAEVDGVWRVLSGMNEPEQIEENCHLFKEMKQFTENERKAVEKAAEIVNSKTAIACTGCEYCVQGCPMGIAIPKYFALYNSIMRTQNSNNSPYFYYDNIVRSGHGKAGDCIQCHQCEGACPQHLKITELLPVIADKFEKNNPFHK